MYDYELWKTVEKIFFKLAKKNPKQLMIIEKKINSKQSSALQESKKALAAS